MNQPILLYRSGSVYANETAAWAALDAVTHKKGQPIVAFYTLSSPVIGHHGSSTIGAIFAIGIGDGVGQYKACTSHDDMLIVAQSLNAHITQFNQMFEYDANHNAIKAKLDFYTTDGKSISAGGIGSGSSASLGALYQLVDVMANSSNTGVEGAVEGSVLAYDATAGKWKAIAQSEILPDMSGYYTKDETDSAINTAKSNLQGQVDTLQALIPATASATNQLADKAFVNSSIATATAEFKGSFTSLDELKATSGNLNDYAFYLHTDSVGNSIVDRYKWTTAGWLYEYTLNNSSFTAEQWAALNSAITATLVQSYNSHLKNSTIHITSDERTKWNNKWDYNEATIKAVKVNAAVSADKLATANEGTSAIPIYFKNGKPAQCIPSDLFSGFANAYSSTGERSLGITIAGNTRMVVVAYSTLAGSADKLATARTLWGQSFDGSANVSGDLKDVRNITASGKAIIQGDIVCGGEVVAVAGEGTPAGVTDYSALTGKPQINGVTLVSGNNTLASLGIQAAGDYATNSGVTTLLADYATKVFVSNNYAGKSAFNAHIADNNIHITSAERAAWDNKWDYNEATIKAVKVNSASSADSVAWSGISGKPTTFTPSAHTHTASEVSGLPTSLKNPYALTFGSKTYDGSAAATITASDLGALTAHQSIYALTLQVNGTSKGVYNPASAAKTINIAVPTKTSDITNDSGFITSAAIPTALKNPYAVEIKANGVSLGTYDGSAAATFNLSAANVGAANKVHSHYSIVTEGDNRRVATTPNDYVNSFVFRGIKENITISSPSSCEYSYLIGLRGWNDLTGGATHELAFNDSGIFRRQGSTTEWGSWYKLIDTGNFTKSLVEGVLRGNITSHTHTFASLTSKPTTISGYGITDAITAGNIGSQSVNYATNAGNADTLDGHYSSEFLYSPSPRGFADGTFIQTNIPFRKETPFYVEICSNGYEDGIINSRFQGYYYQTSLTRCYSTHLGTSRIKGFVAMNYNDKLAFWFPRQGYWCGYRVFVSDVSNNATQYNRVTSVTNSTKPSNSYEYTFSDGNINAFITSNVASATKLQTPRTIWGQSFDGNANVDGWFSSISTDFRMHYNTNTLFLQVESTALILGEGTAATIPTYVLGKVIYFGSRLGFNTMTITNGGNILIGTTTDNGYKLQVNGSERVYGDLIVDGEVSALVA